MKKINKKVLTGTLAAAFVLGGGLVGIKHNQAFASTPTTSQQSSAQAQQAEVQDQETADDDANGQAADQETADDINQSSLQQQATVTQDKAVATATAQVQGTVKDAQLEDEDGTIVYNIQILDANGQAWEVKVDAKNDTVTKKEQAGKEQADGNQEKQDAQDNGQDGEANDDNQ